MTPEPIQRLKARFLREAKRLFGMFLYLWAVLALFTLHESIVLAKHQINYRPYGLAFINAWVLAKVMLIADDLNLGGDWFERRPLIYRISSRAALFAVVFLCVHAAEGILVGLWEGKTIAEIVPEVSGRSAAGILSAGVILSVALMPYFAFKAIDRALGTGVLRSLLLERRRGDSSSKAEAQEPEK